MSWAYLMGAIGFEVTGTMFLRASEGLRNKRWLPAIIGCYVVSFGCLSLALSAGMGIGVAYGIWSAIGISLTAVIARVLFRDALTPKMGVGITVIAVGVLLVEFGAH